MGLFDGPISPPLGPDSSVSRCARLNLPYSNGSSSSSSSPSISCSSSEGGSPMGHHNCPYGKSNRGGAPKPVRRSYKISHFDDTYSSNEKRSKVETIQPNTRPGQLQIQLAN